MKGFRTIIANTVAALPFVAELAGQVFNLPETRGLVPVEYVPYYVIGVTIMNYGLRFITTTPVGKK